MLLSEFISKLQEELDLHGDMPVSGCEGDPDPGWSMYFDNQAWAVVEFNSPDHKALIARHDVGEIVMLGWSAWEENHQRRMRIHYAVKPYLARMAMH